MPSILNPQDSYTQTGVGLPYQSKTIFGKDLNLSWTAISPAGPFGNPDLCEGVLFNLTLISGQSANNLSKTASISFSSNDIAAILQNATTLQSPVTLQLVEVIVCNNGASGRMIVLGSMPYN